MSYDGKHNEANGENNADGDSNNLSWNCGEEGATENEAVKQLRMRQKKNFLGTLLISQGVPMIRAGDELGHTQLGNNNAYCQDNKISWLYWLLDAGQQRFLDFVCKVIQLKLNTPVLHRPNFFQGRPIRGLGIKDIFWLDSAGEELQDEKWNSSAVRCLGLYLPGNAISEVTERAEVFSSDSILILLNSQDQEAAFKLPVAKEQTPWKVVFDTSTDEETIADCAPGSIYNLKGRSMVVLRIPLEEIS